MLLAGGWLGFAFGVVVSLSVLKFGFFGLGVGLLLTIPQGLFYVAGALVMFQGLADWKWNFANWLAFPGRKLMTGTVCESLESPASFLSDLKEKRKI